LEYIVARSLEILAVIVLSTYFPILTYSFFKYRLVRKQEELMLLLERVDLVSTFNRKSLITRLEKEYAPGDYFLPVSFVSMITLLGMILLLPSWIIYDFNSDSYASLLFSGAEFWTEASEYATEKRSVAVIAFAIMGSYISGSRYIYRRFNTVDLTPGNFFSVGLRTIMAALVSLMLSFVITDKMMPGYSENLILVIAFLTGIFPETGFKMLLDRVKIFPKELNEGQVNFSLDYIEGISDMHKIRLGEVGIDNVQNLAQYNFILLIIKTPFPVRTLLDWSAQAKLIVEFRGDYGLLQKAGIRTALDFIDACEDEPGRFEKIAEICGVNQLLLEVNYENFKNDQSVNLLNHFRHYLEQFKLEEKS